MLEAERERLALWLPVVIGAGVAVWFVAAGPVQWALAMIIGASVALAGAVRGRNGAGGRSSLIVIVGGLAFSLGVGLVWAKSLSVAAPVIERPTVTRFEARVETVAPIAAREIVRIVVRPISRPDLPPRVRINIPDGASPAPIQGGDVLALRARLMPPAGSALPGGYDFARRAWFDQLGATGSTIGAVRHVSRSAGGASLRTRLSAHIRRELPGSPGSIAAAFATGDQGAVSETDAQAMRDSGLAHLLSVSGLHVTAMVGAAFLLTLKLLALSPTLALRWPLTLVAAGAGAAAGIGYTLLSGAEVPTIRACISALLVLVALAMGREALTLRLVAAGAIFVLVFWPESLVGPSFQLSFAAVTAIVALHEQPRVKAFFARRDEAMSARLGRILLSLLVTGLVVEVALAPIALFHFHKAGLYGAFANIIAIPLTTFVIMPLEALALLFDVIGLGAPIWWLTGAAIDVLLGLAHFTAARPGSAVMLPAIPTWSFGLFVLAGLWILIWQGRMRWLALPLLGLAGAAMATAPRPDLLITGDARQVAVRTSDGQVMILRDRAGDYVRDMIAESSGFEGELTALREAPATRCSSDFCVWTIDRGGREWTVMSSTSKLHVDAGELIRACARVDIVISERWLPRSCSPRWLKADRNFLRANGGLAITLDPPMIRTTLNPADRHPWRRN